MAKHTPTLAIADVSVAIPRDAAAAMLRAWRGAAEDTPEYWLYSPLPGIYHLGTARLPIGATEPIDTLRSVLHTRPQATPLDYAAAWAS